MKKFLALILCLALMCSVLSVGASAAAVMLSPQNLSVDGRNITCEKYNIDGSNYFKLRDLAFLLKDTAAVFGVDYSESDNSVIVVPGMPYEPNGSELVVGADKSATAVPSAQHIWIMGTDSDGLSIYNIGGNNYFKLRDMGTALGFLVDYDAATNTAIVTTSDYAGSSVDQMLAFDKLWNWVQDNYTFAGGDDLYYLMDHGEWDDGDSVEYWLVDTTVDGEPVLGLRLLYFFANGASDETWLYLTKNTRPYDVTYCYYYDYDTERDDPPFRGELTLDPAILTADGHLDFDTVSGGFDQESVDIAADNVSTALSWLVTNMNEFVSSTTDLYATVDIEDFGFTRAALAD